LVELANTGKNNFSHRDIPDNKKKRPFGKYEEEKPKVGPNAVMPIFRKGVDPTDIKVMIDKFPHLSGAEETEGYLVNRRAYLRDFYRKRLAAIDKEK